MLFCPTDYNPAIQKEPSLRELMNVAAKVTASWKSVAIQLELGIECIDRIDQEKRKTDECFIEVFKSWKQRTSRPYTWATIIDALDCVGEKRVATEIEKNLSSQPAASSENIHSGGDPDIPSDPPRKRKKT